MSNISHFDGPMDPVSLLGFRICPGLPVFPGNINLQVGQR